MIFSRPKPPRCPACGYAMTCLYESLVGRDYYYSCLRALSDPLIHNEYMKAHPEEFQK